MPSDDPPDRPGACAPRPFAESLCWQCRAHRTIQGARSIFLMCEALPSKYPPQPVRVCPAYRPAQG